MTILKPRTERLRRGIVRWVKAMMVVWRHWNDVELLASFDDHMLADIGLTRADLHDAIAEPRWRDPTTLLDVRRCERLAGRRKAVLRFADQIVDRTAFRRHLGEPVGRQLLTG